MRKFVLTNAVGILGMCLAFTLSSRLHPSHGLQQGEAFGIFLIALCATAAVYAGRDVGWRARAVSGFLQALSFLLLFSRDRPELRDPKEVTRSWMTWIVLYTVIFTVVTHVLGQRVARDIDAGQHCKACGYNLYGLRGRRCPECGQAFEPHDANRGARNP